MKRIHTWKAASVISAPAQRLQIKNTLLSKHESVFLFDCHAWRTWKCSACRREGGEEGGSVCMWGSVACVSVCSLRLTLWRSERTWTEFAAACVLRAAGILCLLCEYATCVAASRLGYLRFAWRSLNVSQLHQTNSVPRSGKAEKKKKK